MQLYKIHALVTSLLADNSTAGDSVVLCENSFGPISNDCRNDFDFTLLFEQSILSLAPSVILLFAIPLRASVLWREKKKVQRHPSHGIKIGISIILGALQLMLLIFWAQRDAPRTKVSLAAASLGVADALGLCILSHAEHHRSVKPSFIICIYLFFSVLFDAVQCRTLWLLPASNLFVAATSTALVSIKLLMLVLEAQEKRHILQDAWCRLGPEATSGLFSQSVFWWLNGMMIRGFRTTLSMEMLYQPDEELRSEFLLNELQKRKRNNGSKYDLLFSLFCVLRRSLLVAVFPRICLIGFKFAQPFLINRIITYVQSNSGSTDEGYGLIVATGIIYIGSALSNGFYKHKTYRTITMVRGALVSLICGEALRLDVTTAVKSGSAVLTLTSTDVERICGSFQLFHELWANLIEISIALWLLERQLGLACISPGLIFLGCTTAAVRLSKYMGPRRKIWNDAIQSRVSITSTILGLIKEVKLLGLQDHWLRKIQTLRIEELKRSKSFRMFIVYMNLIGNIPSVLGPTATFGIFILISSLHTSQPLTIATAFTSFSIISLLTAPLAQLMSAIPLMGSSVGCFHRIKAFLDQARVTDTDTPVSRTTEGFDTELSVLNAPSNVIINISNGSLDIGIDPKPLLQDINLQIRRSTLTVITGKVGSGKSTLLKVLLAELPLSCGTISKSYTAAAYCDQVAWLLNSSVQQNILAQSTMDAEWYSTVINACGLEQDLVQLPRGDQTIIGSKGFTLSGGQKQRVALARAIYSRESLVIVDDVLSGLDWTTQNIIWARVFSPVGLLRKQGATIILATHFFNHLYDTDNIIILKEDQLIQGNYASLSHNGYLKASLGESVDPQMNAEVPKEATEPVISAPDDQVERDDLRSSGDLSLYTYYFTSIGLLYGSIGIALNICTTFLLVYLQVWLRFWTQSNERDADSRIGFYYGIYVMISVLSIMAFGLNIWFMFVVLIPKSAESLHLTLIRKVIRAPISFFAATDTGGLVNRFSQDMSLVDFDLPSALFMTVTKALTCIGDGILIMLGSVYLFAIVPVVVLVLYSLQAFYLRTPRQIRLLDLEAKSPLYTHLLETVSGLPTIRAFGWQEPFREKSISLLDISQKPYYLLFCIQRWLNLVLDLCVAGIAVTLVALAVVTGSSSGGAIALALVNVLSFNDSLADLITSWTSLETSLGSISRLKSFEKETPTEIGGLEEPTNWPSDGEIQFDNVNASYGARNILKEISLHIRPRQKIAICGRTGSGKSSLLLALFGLLPLDSSSIKFDSIDITTIPLEFLRKSLIAVPQEPILFPGTLRSNVRQLLPRCSDEEIVQALQKVDLWETVSSHGLSADISEIPLSQGQKQLFCLARAVLQKHSSPVVVLDESMSSVDHETEKLMMKIVEEEFVDHTVIAVVHRLNTVLNYDIVAVLDDGCLLEVGNPKDLLKQDSKFRRLWGSFSAVD